VAHGEESDSHPVAKAVLEQCRQQQAEHVATKATAPPWTAAAPAEESVRVDQPTPRRGTHALEKGYRLLPGSAATDCLRHIAKTVAI